MKKIIFLFVALLSVITMSAKDDVTVKSGSLAEAEAEFAKALGKSKFVNVTTEKDQAQYIITIKVKDFNYGNTAVAVWVGMGAGDAHFNATVEFTKNGSKETVAVLDADGVPGGGFGNEARRRDAYEELGECLVKLIKKAK